MISLRSVTKRFDGRAVLDGLDLDLAAGAVTALMGSNGSGKTTVGRLLLGLLAPDGGAVHGIAGRRRAAVFQEDHLCEHLTAADNVRLVLPRGSRVDAPDHLRRVGLVGDSLRTPVRDLSGGQRRRVAIARAVAADADLLTLDEPFTGLDVEAKGQVMDYVRTCARGTTLLITHDSAEATWFGADPFRLPPPREPAPHG